MTRRRKGKGGDGTPARGNRAPAKRNDKFYDGPDPIVLTHHEKASSGKGGGRPGKPGGRKTAAGPTGRPGSPGGRPNGQNASGRPGSQPDGRPANKRKNRRRRPYGPRRDQRQQAPGGPQQNQGPDSQAPRPSGRPAPEGAPDPFTLFCSYHLGLTPDGKYKTQNVHEIARRHNLSAAEIKQLLVDYGIDSDTVINADFDMALAQLDIMVAPEGVDRRELAKAHYEEFLEAPKKARDWEKEIQEDKEANRKIFGR